MCRILNQSQAEAIYSAACALQNVGGVLTCELETVSMIPEQRMPIRVFEWRDATTGKGNGRVRIVLFTSRLVFDMKETEDYSSWDEFARAYETKD